MLVLKIICILILTGFSTYEIVSMVREGTIKKYFKDYWNIIDLVLFLLYVPTSIVDIFNLEVAYI